MEVLMIFLVLGMCCTKKGSNVFGAIAIILLGVFLAKSYRVIVTIMQPYWFLLLIATILALILFKKALDIMYKPRTKGINESVINLIFMISVIGSLLFGTILMMIIFNIKDGFLLTMLVDPLVNMVTAQLSPNLFQIVLGIPVLILGLIATGIDLLVLVGTIPFILSIILMVKD